MYSIIERNIPDARNELHEMGLLPKDSRPVFQIGSCVVVESVSTTRYVLPGYGFTIWREKATILAEDLPPCCPI